MPCRADLLYACLLGTAVGDSIALPYENLSPARIKKWRGDTIQQRLLFRRWGMVSDDTDHTIFVAQSLLSSRGDVALFKQQFAWRLRFWLCCFPAGIGMSTLKSILKLCLGVPFKYSAVFSAGNAPSMRSAILGAVYCDHPSLRNDYVSAATQLTHSDPLALIGAQAIAEIAAHLANQTWQQRPTLPALQSVLIPLSAHPIWLKTVQQLLDACAAEDSIAQAKAYFSSQQGISGYTMHSVPFAIVVWYRHFADYHASIESVIAAGGDTDTVAAMVGALVGLSVSATGIPLSWQNDLIDYPHNKTYLRQLAEDLASPHLTPRSPSYFGISLFLRGIIFSSVILLHGFRRLLPPYA